VDNLYSTFIIFQVLQRSCVFGLGASSCARQVFDDIPHFHGAGERITNVLWNQGSQVLPLALQSFISEGFAVDIHPAAKIGEGI